MNQITEVQQTYGIQQTETWNGFPTNMSLLANTVHTTATALYDAKGARMGHANEASSQDVVMANSDGMFYKGRVTSANGIVTSIEPKEPELKK